MKVVAKRKWRYPMSLERQYAKQLVAYVKRKFAVIDAHRQEIVDVVAQYAVRMDDDSLMESVSAQISVLLDRIERDMESADDLTRAMNNMFDAVNRYNASEFNALTKSLFGFPLRVPVSQIAHVDGTGFHMDTITDEEIEKILKEMRKWFDFNIEESRNSYNNRISTLKMAWVRQNLSLIKSIDSETMRRIEDKMMERIIANVSMGDLTKYLIKDIQDIAGVEINRATLIGVDQVGKLNSRLTQYRQEHTGISEYQWETALDGRVRPSHRPRQGKIYKWSNPPPDGHPGYPIRCRCVALPVIDLDKIPILPKKGSYQTAQSKTGTVNQSKKRDHKIMITDIAIDKVGYVTIQEIGEAAGQIIQEEHKELLRTAKEYNNSNEVLTIMTIDGTLKIRILGSEYSVDPSSSPEAYSIMRTAGSKSVMYLHNHPSTKSFSLPDIVTFLRYNQIGIMTVVTNQGEVYVLHKTAKYDYNKVRNIFNVAYAAYLSKEKNHDEAVSEFLKNCHKGGIEYVRSK